jgi:hypothetical protein
MAYLIYLTGWALLPVSLTLSIAGMALRSIRIRVWAWSVTITAATGIGSWLLRVHDWPWLAADAVLLAVAWWGVIEIYLGGSARAQTEKLIAAGKVMTRPAPPRG